MLLCWAMSGSRWRFRQPLASTAPRQRQVAPLPFLGFIVVLQKHQQRCPNLHSADLQYPGPAIAWHTDPAPLPRGGALVCGHGPCMAMWQPGRVHADKFPGALDLPE